MNILENYSNENFEKKERQLENLENLVENHTRTKRHLEQYSYIGDEENKNNAREKQEIREQKQRCRENKKSWTKIFKSPHFSKIFRGQNDRPHSLESPSKGISENGG